MLFTILIFNFYKYSSIFVHKYIIESLYKEIW